MPHCIKCEMDSYEGKRSTCSCSTYMYRGTVVHDRGGLRKNDVFSSLSTTQYSTYSSFPYFPCTGDRRIEARGTEARGTEARGTEAMGD